MDEPDDFTLPQDYYTQINPALFKVGDLVAFSGYHYSPDYIYIDGDDYTVVGWYNGGSAAYSATVPVLYSCTIIATVVLALARILHRPPGIPVLL